MSLLFSFLESASFVAAIVLAAWFRRWEPATFALVLAIFSHLQLESLESQRIRTLLARALSEPSGRRRGGLPWASYYLLVIAAIGLAGCTGEGGLTPLDLARHECTVRLSVTTTHAETLATLNYRPIGFSGGRFPRAPCSSTLSPDKNHEQGPRHPFGRSPAAHDRRSAERSESQ